MPTDKERREAAARLRRLAEKHDGVTWFLVEKHTGLAPDERYMGSSVYTSESVARLADLVEPSCDRDALLEEVKELEKCAWYFGLDFDDNEPLRDRLKEASEAFMESARSIRLACGAEVGE